MYDQANRLTNVNGNGLAWSAMYASAAFSASNGDGARLRQVTNGVPTTYTLDPSASSGQALNAGLVQVLAQQDASGTTAYLYGVTRIGEQQPSGWAYHLSDALGSVRQLADDAAQVTLARGYMPYGEALWSLGDGSSAYGFTGEDWNAVTQLAFLRARYMQPGLGMFLSHDPWEGDAERPGSMNGWNYVEGDSINRGDPSGYGYCLSLIGVQPPFMTVGQAIDMCKAMYDKNNKKPFIDCGQWCSQPWSEPSTVHDLTMDWLCEHGPNPVYLGGRNPLTQEMAKSILLDGIRQRFYQQGDIPITTFDFNMGGFFAAWLDAGFSIGRFDAPISQFVGGFEYQVHSISSDRAGFWVRNETDLASGTHLVGRQRPAYYESLEELADQDPQLRNKWVSEVVNSNSYRVISILKATPRGSSAGGGTMTQIFNWSERKLDCDPQQLPWPVYLEFLDIRERLEPGDVIPKV